MKSKTIKKPVGKRNKTIRKDIRERDASKAMIVATFLEILNTVKLFHWRTKSYAKHKATDELYSKLNENIDTFIEVLLGKSESRIHSINKQCEYLNFNHFTDFRDKIYEFRDFLIKMNTILNTKKDSDLLSIRDAILADINQFLYLTTFK